MLEPLIVITVLNCVFMFSSTMTTCALWWQYRSHRCCFNKKSTKQCNAPSGKSGSSCACKALRKERAKQCEKAKKTKCQPRCKKSGEEKAKRRPCDEDEASEASHTPNDAKSAVVMEYSTLQKIVKILDDDSELAATKLAINDLNSKQGCPGKANKCPEDSQSRVQSCEKICMN